jgi:alkanesulfonate monooxygenase SsuD/methylene tetrahydromethanopterin reductase-like flavin-dependent oxidoreductase (luciferase family)
LVALTSPTTPSGRGAVNGSAVLEDAEVYTLPEELPPILVAASGSKSVLLAARIGDGLVSLEPDRELIEAFIAAGGGRSPVTAI